MATLNLRETTQAPLTDPKTGPRPRVKTLELFAECLVCGGESDQPLCLPCASDLDKAAARVKTANLATDEWVRFAHVSFVVPAELTTWWGKVEAARMEGDPRFEAAWQAVIAAGGEKARVCRAWEAFDRRCAESAATRERLVRAQRAINAAWLDAPMDKVA